MERVQLTDFAKLKKLGNLTLSPSGKKAVFLVTRPDIDDNRNLSELWAYDDTRSPALFPLTKCVTGQLPAFLDEDTLLLAGDPDGRYPSTPTSRQTLYSRVSLADGSMEEAFVLPFAASSLTPVGDDLYLFSGQHDLTAPDLSGLDETEKAAALKEWENSKSYDTFDELPFWFDAAGITNKIRQGLYLADTKANTQTLLTSETFKLHSFRVNASRTRVFFWGVDFLSVNRGHVRAFLYDLTDGSRIEVPLEEKYTMDGAVFVGEQVIFIASTGEQYSYAQNKEFYLCQPDGSFTLLAAPDYSLGTLGSDVTGSNAAITTGRGYYLHHTVDFHGVYSCLSADGTMTMLVGPDDVSVVSCAAGTEDLIYFVGAQKDGLQELYRKRNGVTERLSSFNEEYFATHAIAHTEHFTFTDSDGVEMDGWILRPADFDPAKRYPAILSIHGGPKYAFADIFYHQKQYWAAEGYIVFFCNPRGSSGKGDEFADIYGDRYGVTDFNSIMLFTDEVLRRVPQIDPTRVGVTGISYGGFMTNWIIGHTDRFAAAIPQCSISNYFSKCLTTDIGFYWNLSALQCDPWSSPEKMWAHSPLAYADRVKTPTLFIHADADYRCWMGDAIQMLQALLMHGVPAKLCLFHGESHVFHSFGKPSNRINRLKEMTAWFARYLCPNEAEG